MKKVTSEGVAKIIKAGFHIIMTGILLYACLSIPGIGKEGNETAVGMMAAIRSVIVLVVWGLGSLILKFVISLTKKDAPTPAVQIVQATSNQDGIADQLKKLQDLKISGALTEEEFNSMKAKIIEKQ